MSIVQESLYLQQTDYQLHLRYLGPEGEATRQPVLMVHGSIENGRIFYTKSGKGLAAYLAGLGHPVYVLDQRGRGESVPKISAADSHGHYHAITDDLPTVHEFIVGRHQQSVHWIAHSWGGVLLASTLARFPHLAVQVSSQVFFGTKRVIHSWSWERFLKVELFWKRAALLMARFKGYLPVTELRLGADNETRRSLQDNVAWVTPGQWVDSLDRFDYGASAKAVDWPASWLVAAIRDQALGNPADVRAFADEMGENGKGPLNYSLLSKANGNLHDYDHINMLTHPAAVEDHFPEVAQFLRTQESAND